MDAKADEDYSRQAKKRLVEVANPIPVMTTPMSASRPDKPSKKPRKKKKKKKKVHQRRKPSNDMSRPYTTSPLPITELSSVESDKRRGVAQRLFGVPWSQEDIRQEDMAKVLRLFLFNNERLAEKKGIMVL